MHYCIINSQDKEVVNEIENLGYKCIFVVKSNKVSEEVCCHADMLYLKIDKENIIISDCQIKNRAIIESLGYNVKIFNGLNAGYKTESFLNFVINEDTALFNPKTAIKCDFFNKYKCVFTKQGYTKCSTIVISENAYITEDIGIYKALINSGNDCLLIEKGFVELKGHNYGFIGGASVMLKNKILLFFGDITKHKDINKITSFLNKYNVELKYIKDKKLKDIGSGVVV